MSTTLNSPVRTRTAMSVKQFDLTAGAADVTVSTVVYPAITDVGGGGPEERIHPDIILLGVWNKTTGAISPAACTYVKATGVLTIPCANSNNVQATVLLLS